MSAFKLSIDEDLLLIRTSPSILNALIPFRHWSYGIELPTHKIVRTEVVRRAGIQTLIVVKNTAEGEEKNIVVSLAKANKHQVAFLTHALPKIIADRPNMHEINSYIKQYLKPKQKNWLDD